MTVMSLVMCPSLSSSFYVQNLSPTLSVFVEVIKAASLVTRSDLQGEASTRSSITTEIGGN